MAPFAADYPSLPADFFDQQRRSRRKVVHRLAVRSAAPTTGTVDLIRNWSGGGDPEVIPALTAVVERDPDVAVKRAALSGLARIADGAAIPGLLLGLRSSDRASRTHATKGLAKLCAREAVPDLVELLEDRYSANSAAQALLAIRDERALGPLRLAATHGWPWRRLQMRRSVRAFERALGYGDI
jgi:hypothetical protein